MHPNWRALATLHIPLKRFVTEGECVESSSSQKKNYRVENINAIEINAFYQEVINAPETVRKPVKVAKQTEFHQAVPKVPFDQKKLFRAATANDVATLKNLKFKGNDINSKDSFGWTALMMAACEGAADAVEVLISLGIDVNVKDRSGNSAYSLAEKKQFFHVLEILSRCTNELIEDEDDDEEDDDDDAVQKEFFCDICTRKFQETSLRDHVTSTVHQFNLKKDKPTKNRFSIPSKNRGLKIMLKQGWDKESGLGPTNTGRLFPVKTVIRKPRTGLGTQQEPAKVTHFGEYDLRAIKYVERPKTKNRNDIRREKQLEWKRERRLRRELS